MRKVLENCQRLKSMCPCGYPYSGELSLAAHCSKIVRVRLAAAGRKPLCSERCLAAQGAICPVL